MGRRDEKLTLLVTNLLTRRLALGALDGLLVILALQSFAVVIGALGVHGALEGIALPAKEVVTVDTVPGVVTVAPPERLRAVGGPLGLVVELARVVHDLVHDLGDLDGMRGRAGATALEAARGWVGNVRLVVGAVSVLAIPAGREGDRDTPAAAARRLGEVLGVGARAGGATKGALLHVGLAAEAEALGDLGGIAVVGVTNEHAEALGEGRDLGARLVAADVVDGHAALDLEANVGKQGHLLERVIASLEIDVGGPVVGKVLRVGAAGARRLGWGIQRLGIHGCVERVTTNDLVHVARRQAARVDQGVDAVKGQLRAAKAHQLLRSGKLRNRPCGAQSLEMHRVRVVEI